MLMTKMQEEIFEQKTALKTSFEVNLDVAKLVAEKIANPDVKHVVMVARGSSMNACLFFKYLFEVRGGKPITFYNPSVITKYGAAYDFSSALVIGVSQSGQGADVNEVIKQAKEQGAYTVAITNFADSPLAQLCDSTLLLSVGLEKSVAATKTMTAQMLLLKTISDFYKFKEANFSKVYDSITTSLDNFDCADKIANFLADKNEVIVLSRGLSLAVAQEISLKLQETCYINARPYAISDFYHGPFALVDENKVFILISTDKQTRDDSLEMLNKLQALGAKVIAISNDDNINNTADFAFPLCLTCKCASPIGAVIGGQIIALKTALLRGVNPDAPRGLKKITITK